MGDVPVIVGHRANSGRIVQLYKFAGAEYVEIDVRQRGGQILVGHGRPVINRATIIGRAWAWLDYKLFYRDPFLKVHTLREWLDVITSKLDVRGVLLDVKNNIDPEILKREIEKSNFNGLIHISTEDHRRIPRLKELGEVKVLASYSIMPADIIECTKTSRADGVALRRDYVDKSIVEKLHKEGYIVFTWTVNDENEALRVAKTGVDGIITDRPDIVKRALFKAWKGEVEL